MAFELKNLPYSYDSLEPYIDAKTMEIHHQKHHGAYTNNLNNAISGNELEKKSLDELIKNVSKYPAVIRNNGGGYFNHNFFWDLLSPKGGGQPKGSVSDAIKKYFGTYETFVDKFTNTALTRFGSGWAWLCVDNEDKLCICSTPNQDNPLMDIAECKAQKLLIGLDVWEHAYYLKYQNRRADYISAFWNLVNWEEVEKRFK